jgi:hypothetical protein
MKSLYINALVLCTLAPLQLHLTGSPFSRDQQYALVNGAFSGALVGALYTGTSKNWIAADRNEFLLALTGCGLFGIKQLYTYATASTNAKESFNTARFLRD